MSGLMLSLVCSLGVGYQRRGLVDHKPVTPPIILLLAVLRQHFCFGSCLFYVLFVALSVIDIISIFHGCMVWIEKSVMRVTDRHHEACRVMPNSDSE